MKKEYFSKIQNPMTIIALFVGLTEIALSIIVSSDAIEQPDSLIVVMVTFAFVFVIGFFVVLIRFPYHFYGPRDYRSDESFLSLFQSKKLEGFQVEFGDDQSGEKTAKDIREQLVNALHRPFCFYLLKVANKDLSFSDHQQILSNELDTFDEIESFKQLSVIGYLYGVYSNYDGVLFRMVKVDNDKDIIHMQVSTEVLALVGQRLGASSVE